MTLNFRNIVPLVIWTCLTISPSHSQNHWQQTNGPYGGGANAFTSLGAYLFTGRQGVYRSSDDGMTWWDVSDSLAGKYVTTLVVNGTTIFAGTYDMGVFRSIDNGSHWRAANAGLADFEIQSLLVKGSTIFAGTFGWGTGVFRSTDNGSSWQSVNNGMPQSRIDVLGANDSAIFAGTYGSGIFRSMDDGMTWRAVNSGLTSSASLFVQAFAFNGPYAFAGTKDVIFRSTDYGNTWQGLNGGFGNVLSLTISGSTLCAGPNGEGVYRSTDNGSNWQKIDINSNGSYIYVLGFYRYNSNIFAGTLGDILRSTDGGLSWNEMNNGMECSSVNTLEINGAKIFAGTSFQGIFSTTDGGASWVNTATQPLMNSVYEFASSSSVFLAATDGGILRSTDNGTTWLSANTGLSDPSVQALLINGSSIFSGTSSGIFRSTDGGATWQGVNRGISYIFSLISNGTTLFAGSDLDGIFRSTDDGANWEEINSGLTNKSIYTLITNGSTVFAGTMGGGVYRSDDNGNNWLGVNNGLTDLVVYSFATAGSGILAGTSGGVFASYNHGDTWHEIMGLRGVRISSLLIYDSIIYAGTYGHSVFKTQFYTLTAPTLDTPSNGMVNVPGPPILSWQASPGALCYHVQVCTGSDFTGGFLVNDSTTVDTSRSVSGLTGGVQYYWRVRAISAFGAGPFSSTYSFTTLNYPATVQLSKTFSFGDITDTTNYRMISLPGVTGFLVDSLFQNKGSFGQDWVVYWDNGSDNDYLQRDDHQSPVFQFQPGRAFWTLSRDSITVDRSVGAVTLTAGSYAIPLHGGWNLMGDPYERDISWNQITQTNSITQPIYSFDGQYTQSSTLNPYSGYYFYNSTGLGALVIPYPGAAAPAKPSRKNDQGKDDFLSLALQDNGIRLSGASVYFSGSASIGMDNGDIFAPPGGFERAGIRILNQDLPTSYKYLAIDSRPYSDSGQMISLRVINGTKRILQLVVAAGERLKNTSIALIDNRLRKVYNLQDNPVVEISPYHLQSSYSLVIGPEEFIAEKTRDMKPGAYALCQNVPNPFNPSTIIRIAVPSRSMVKVGVYDLLGRQLTVLTDKSLAEGEYEFLWDARDVATGMYLCRMEAASLESTARFVMTQKMLLVR